MALCLRTVSRKDYRVELVFSSLFTGEARSLFLSSAIMPSRIKNTAQRIGHRDRTFCRARCLLLSTAGSAPVNSNLCGNYLLTHRITIMEHKQVAPTSWGLGGWRRDRGLLFAGKEQRNIPRPGQEKN